MEKELKIETAKSNCPKIQIDKEFQELFQTKRTNYMSEKIDINIPYNSKNKNK